MLRTSLIALAACTVLGTAPALAAASTPKEIVERHTASGGDLDKLMADYADDSVVLQEGRAVQGKPAIRALFERMFPKPAPGAPAAPSAPKAGGAGGMKVTKVWEDGDVGFMTWERGPMKATEEFLVRDGKIEVQTIFMSPMPPPPGGAAGPAGPGGPPPPPSAPPPPQ